MQNKNNWITVPKITRNQEVTQSWHPFNQSIRSLAYFSSQIFVEKGNLVAKRIIPILAKIIEVYDKIPKTLIIIINSCEEDKFTNKR